jgi:hypothetical protein
MSIVSSHKEHRFLLVVLPIINLNVSSVIYERLMVRISSRKRRKLSSASRFVLSGLVCANVVMASYLSIFHQVVVSNSLIFSFPFLIRAVLKSRLDCCITSFPPHQKNLQAFEL